MDANNRKQEPQKGPAKTLIRPGLTLPHVTRPPVETSRKGLAGCLMDTSGSMAEGNKIVDANMALRAFHTGLADPATRRAFYLGVIAYAERAEERLKPTIAADVDPNEIGVAVGSLGDQTNITSALILAKTVLSQAATLPCIVHQPVFVLMTDGIHNKGPDPMAAAAALKGSAIVVCAAFGSDADVRLLERLATSPGHVERCVDGAALLRFFAKVSATISAAASSGQSVAALLGGKTYQGLPGKR